jgi:hypothetical protein
MTGMNWLQYASVADCNEHGNKPLEGGNSGVLSVCCLLNGSGQ